MKVLVPLDGSEYSERVFPWLRFLLQGSKEKAEVLLLRAFEPPSQVYLLPELSIPTSHGFSDEYLGGKILSYLTEKQVELSDLGVEVEMTLGDPAAEVLDRAPKFDLVLMSGRGRGGFGRWLLGSVATKVIRSCETPVMIVGKNVPPSPQNKKQKIEKILVPVDGSEIAERAFEYACELAGRWDADVWLYQGVFDREGEAGLEGEAVSPDILEAKSYLDRLAERYESLRTFFEVSLTSGQSGIVDMAEKKNADLIVMGSRGKSGIARWMLGSETEHAIRHAGCPVLVVH